MNNSPILDIESLDMEARGVGHLPNDDGSPGKVIFVEGALPGERVRFKSYRRKAKWEAAQEFCKDQGWEFQVITEKDHSFL
jgi:23S rRNA (uracil1939-C5)-methyltransferase